MAEPSCLECPRCASKLFHVYKPMEDDLPAICLLVPLVCAFCHTEFELWPNGHLQLVREPAAEPI